MGKNNLNGLTERNLDRLAEFLKRELEQPGLAPDVPSGAHIFHGSYNDTTLTQDNVSLATRILLGMTLGYIDEAPLVMVYEYRPGRQTVIDLSSNAQKERALSFIQLFQEQSQQEMVAQIQQRVVT
ncbi:MAG: hypothetical protein AB1791_05485 [Chloroflexota bacterium]